LERITDLSEMRDRLTEMGYLDAAKETESILLMITAFKVRIEARMERLSNVWHSVEWKDSGDFGMDAVEESIKKYRED
jgi:hypothetical protein